MAKIKINTKDVAKNISSAGVIPKMVIEQTIPKLPLQDNFNPNTKNSFGEDFTLAINHAQNQQNIIAEDQRLTNIENKDVGDKYFGLSAVFDGSDVGGVIDYFKYDRGITRGKDENFLKTFNKDTEDMILENFGLNESSRPYIQEAKNPDHLLDLATKEQLRTEALEKTLNTYSDTENLVANLAVGMATDPTILLTGGASMLVRGAAALAKSGKVVSMISKASQIGKEVGEITTTTQFGALASSTILDLHRASQIEASLMVVNDMKQGLAKAVIGSSVSYGAVLGATQEDTSMIEGLLAYGLLSPIDYKIINGIKVLDKTPRELGLGKNTVDAMYSDSLRLEKRETLISPKKLHTQEELLQLERKVTASSILSKADKEALKTSIKSRLRISKNTGFKKMIEEQKKIVQKLEKEKIKTKATENKLFNKAKRLRIVEQELDDIHELANDIEMNIADVKKSLEVISKTSKGKENIARDILDTYKSMHEGGYLSKSAYKQLEASYKKGKGKGFKHPKIEIKAKTDPKTGESIAELKINNKVVKVLGASALAAAGLNAYDGGDLASDASSIVGLGLVMALLGVGVLHNFKTVGMKQAIRSGIEKVAKGKAYDNSRPIRSKIGNVFNNSRVSLVDTVKPILDNTTGRIHDFANKFYFNPLDQTNKTIETTKRIFSHSKSQGLERELRDIFAEWRGSQDISTMKNVASMFTDMSFRAKFNKQVWEHMTMGLHSKDMNVIAGAKKVSEYYKQALKEMKESGIKNADKMITVTDDLYYVPRIHNGLEFANKITGISKASKNMLISNFANMLTKTPEARRFAVAEAYIENMIKRDVNAGKTFSKDTREALIKELEKKGLNPDEIDEVVSTISGSYGRTKARLFMDYSKFNKINANINGVDVPITIDDLFMTDISSISNTLFNQVGGHVAFAANGFSSVDDAISLVRDANMLESHRATMLNDIYATVGVPAIDYSQTANIVAKNIANMSVAKLMMYSTISLMSESFVYLSNTIRTAGIFEGMKNLSKTVRGFGDDSFIASDIPFGKDGLGLGQQRYGSTYGQFRTFDEFSNQDSGIGKFTKFSEMWRDFTLHTMPFSRTSDFIAKANLQDVMDRLYKHISGEKPFEAYELSAFPISNKMRKYLEKNLSLNKKGHIKFFDYTQDSFEIRDEFKNLIDNMMVKRMNQTTMGTSGAYSRNSALGVGLSSMLKYPMSAYSNLGGFLGRGAMQGDAFAMTQIALWFQAGMLQSIIRSEIQGRDYDENDVIVAGLMNMPQYGLLGTVTGLGHSPTSNVAKNMTDVLDIYSYTK